MLKHIKKIFPIFGVPICAVPFLALSFETRSSDEKNKILYDNKIFTSIEKATEYYLNKNFDNIIKTQVFGSLERATVDYTYHIVNKALLPDYDAALISPAYRTQTGEIISNRERALASYANIGSSKNQYTFQGASKYYFSVAEAEKAASSFVTSQVLTTAEIPKPSDSSQKIKINPTNNNDIDFLKNAVKNVFAGDINKTDTNNWHTDYINTYVKNGKRFFEPIVNDTITNDNNEQINLRKEMLKKIGDAVEKSLMPSNIWQDNKKYYDPHLVLYDGQKFTPYINSQSDFQISSTSVPYIIYTFDVNSYTKTVNVKQSDYVGPFGGREMYQYVEFSPSYKGNLMASYLQEPIKDYKNTRGIPFMKSPSSSTLTAVKITQDFDLANSNQYIDMSRRYKVEGDDEERDKFTDVIRTITPQNIKNYAINFLDDSVNQVKLSDILTKSQDPEALLNFANAQMELTQWMSKSGFYYDDEIESHKILNIKGYLPLDDINSLFANLETKILKNKNYSSNITKGYFLGDRLMFADDQDKIENVSNVKSVSDQFVKQWLDVAKDSKSIVELLKSVNYFKGLDQIIQQDIPNTTTVGELETIKQFIFYLYRFNELANENPEQFIQSFESLTRYSVENMWLAFDPKFLKYNFNIIYNNNFNPGLLKDQTGDKKNLINVDDITLDGTLIDPDLLKRDDIISKRSPQISQVWVFYNSYGEPNVIFSKNVYDSSPFDTLELLQSNIRDTLAFGELAKSGFISKDYFFVKVNGSLVLHNSSDINYIYNLKVNNVIKSFITFEDIKRYIQDLIRREAIVIGN